MARALLGVALSSLKIRSQNSVQVGSHQSSTAIRNHIVLLNIGLPCIAEFAVQSLYRAITPNMRSLALQLYASTKGGHVTLVPPNPQ